MQNIEICLFEPDAPSILVTWKKDTLKKGGIVAPDSDLALIEIANRSINSGNYFIVLYGAWLGLCVAELALKLSCEMKMPVAVDLARSFAEREAVDMGPDMEVLDCAGRLDWLLKSEPKLKDCRLDLSHDGKIINLSSHQQSR